MKYTILLLLFLCVGCDTGDPGNPAEWPAYANIIPDSRQQEAAKWILEVVAAANPHSDEEPEDNIAQAEKTALKLFGVPTLGMRMRRNGVWVFVPFDKLSAEKQASCAAWSKLK